MDVLLVDVGLPGFPAEAADHGGALGIVPDAVGTAADTIAIAVVRVFVGEDVGLGDGFEQTQANHWRRHAGRETGVRVHRTIAQLGDLQGRLAQFDLVAIFEGDGLAVVGHPYLAFRRYAGDRHVLQLGAVDRLRDYADSLDLLGQEGLVGDRQAHQHRHRVIGVRLRRMAAAVAHVAVLAGVGVEQRAEAIAGGGGGRGDDPRVAEKAVADGEVQAAFCGKIGRR
ncbi:hypothetical protein D3C81_1113430 [compost metagenome]